MDEMNKNNNELTIGNLDFKNIIYNASSVGSSDSYFDN